MKKFAEGKPAEFKDFIVDRRIRILQNFENFFDIDAELLDVGCGNGASIIKIHSQFRSCHGVDIIQKHLNNFNLKIDEFNLNNCSCSLENVDEDFCKNKSFNRIISFEVLEHVGKDQELANRIYRMIQHGGEVAISVPNRWWIFETHGAYLPLLPWNRVPFFSWLPKKIHDRYAKARIYRKKDIQKILSKAGFNVVSLNYITAPMDVIKWKPLQQLLRRTVFKNDTTHIPFLSTSIFAFAEKSK